MILQPGSSDIWHWKGQSVVPLGLKTFSGSHLPCSLRNSTLRNSAWCQLQRYSLHYSIYPKLSVHHLGKSAEHHELQRRTCQCSLELWYCSAETGNSRCQAWLLNLSYFHSPHQCFFQVGPLLRMGGAKREK